MIIEKLEVNKDTLDSLNNIVQIPDLNISEKIKCLVEKHLETAKELTILENKQLTAFQIGNAINDGVYTIDRNGVITDANQVYLMLSGLSRSEVIGKHVSLITDAYFEVDKAVSLTALEELGPISKMTRAIKTKKELLVSSTPLFDKDGQLSQVLTVCRDITELNELRDELMNNEKVNAKYLQEVRYLREKQLQNESMIGECYKMQRVKEQINQISAIDATVLITGETGVGKEIVAEQIYKNSKRRDMPYIKVNCAAIPENLLESELFGYEKGAFTGAGEKQKTGLFEMADKGTILLDEIGEISLKIQSKLLRVLQEQEYYRIGGVKPIKVDVRVIAATNKNLKKEVEKGRFREDLYYRLHVIPLHIPPLRERGDDIRLLSKHFMKKYNQKYGLRKNFEPSAIEVLRKYNWPGNIRELGNVVERLAVISNKNEITASETLSILGGGDSNLNMDYSEGQTLKIAVHNFEKRIIEQTLLEHGSSYKAAEVLGVNQSTIVRKAKAYGISLK